MGILQHINTTSYLQLMAASVVAVSICCTEPVIYSCVSYQTSLFIAGNKFKVDYNGFGDRSKYASLFTNSDSNQNKCTQYWTDLCQEASDKIKELSEASDKIKELSENASFKEYQ